MGKVILVLFSAAFVAYCSGQTLLEGYGIYAGYLVGPETGVSSRVSGLGLDAIGRRGLRQCRALACPEILIGRACSYTPLYVRRRRRGYCLGCPRDICRVGRGNRRIRRRLCRRYGICGLREDRRDLLGSRDLLLSGVGTALGSALGGAVSTLGRVTGVPFGGVTSLTTGTVPVGVTTVRRVDLGGPVQSTFSTGIGPVVADPISLRGEGPFVTVAGGLDPLPPVGVIDRTDRRFRSSVGGY